MCDGMTSADVPWGVSVAEHNNVGVLAPATWHVAWRGAGYERCQPLDSSAHTRGLDRVNRGSADRILRQSSSLECMQAATNGANDIGSAALVALLEVLQITLA